ncbi:MAG TPA: hypothetical protein PL151_01100 [Phycisphaerae bacterium]|nr:hypothetical protein [Phycisphaerae bacterium]HOJ74551.1 hypothetical protein [Phycisphaerae bacterium]HOM52752.1 hypothetical protein [Phycisphaerae bacterium]HON66604.1 hypothetical protein [Phycisphaerae bacterium]HOQ87727.1 hypothetical protein [Phycisphaerae bacterium]
MPITLICPNLLCRSILQVPDATRGRKVRCGKCGRDFLVPTAENTKNAKKSAAPAAQAE